MTEPAYDLIIRGGRVATATDVFEADVAITGETSLLLAAGWDQPSATSMHAASSCCPVASTATATSSSFPPPAS